MIIILSLSGCGAVECDFYVRGLCVDTGGFPIDSDMLMGTIDIENAILQTDYPEIDITDIFEKENVSLQYVEILPDYRGKTEENEIQIRFTKSCVDRYYVLAHEILHIFAEYGIQAKWSDNANHTVDNLFYSDDYPSIEGYTIHELLPYLASEDCYVNN